jgi:hypothetical protein
MTHEISVMSLANFVTIHCENSEIVMQLLQFCDTADANIECTDVPASN